ncbi:hypothetical protein NQ314_020536 [Rhamnusium bicolor]|uniref:Double jelly roll-like domain-containing protein n=1 Tax=Rhamnusium bicolor TaxID=1586634 RepID=A0AAV8WKQ8_9CUCU|nr:hypothetical protein NQ314_020536 [Rhamnusium bicolor]
MVTFLFQSISFIHINPIYLEANDETRIPVQHLDAYTAPCNSYLYIEGKLSKEDGSESTKLEFINNAIAFLFREIRYEMNRIVIDSVRNVGLVSTIKIYLSYNENESVFMQNAGWFPKKKKGMAEKVITAANENFNVGMHFIKITSWIFLKFSKDHH